MRETGCIFSFHKIKWVEDENLHITLQFIGDIKESDIKSIGEGFGEILLDLKPFEFKFDKSRGCISFPKKSILPGISALKYLGTNG